MKTLMFVLIAAALCLTAKTQQVVSLTTGWNGISTYIELSEPSLDSIFKDLPVTIVKSDHGTVYWPSQGVNTMDGWETNEGYQIHVYADCDVIFYGIPTDDMQIILSPGWHYVPVSVSYPIGAEYVFGFMTGGESDIVKDIAGPGVYWPAKNINTIGYLLPGRAYHIHCDDWYVLNFEIRTGIEPVKIEGKPIDFLWDYLGRRVR
jgi:hypothetical protein